MGFFAQQVHTIIIDDENSVTVTKPNFGKRQDMLSPAAKVGKDENGEQVVVIDPALFKREQLCAWVTSWSGPGFEGLQCKRENILRLPPDIADLIGTEINKIDAPMSDEEKKA